LQLVTILVLQSSTEQSRLWEGGGGRWPTDNFLVIFYTKRKQTGVILALFYPGRPLVLLGKESHFRHNFALIIATATRRFTPKRMLMMALVSGGCQNSKCRNSFDIICSAPMQWR
jgi:hypothetical protein